MAPEVVLAEALSGIGYPPVKAVHAAGPSAHFEHDHAAHAAAILAALPGHILVEREAWDRLCAVEAALEDADRWIVSRAPYLTGAIDHACGECVPGGPLVSDTFTCAVHAAKARALAALTRNQP